MTKQSKPRTLSYLRVSTDEQDNQKFKHDVRAYANRMDFGRVEFVEEKIKGKKSWKTRKIATMIDGMKGGDRLIVPELSRLGRSTLEVLEILKAAQDKGIGVYAVKEDYQLNGDGIQAKMMTTMLALFAEVEHDFISERTKEGLKAARAKGRMLGRPKGPGKSKLDQHRDEIIDKLTLGVPKAKIARRYKTTPANLHNWLTKNKIKVKEAL
jgi:DNA invertase Pin-like site-specific DNA recombinase